MDQLPSVFENILTRLKRPIPNVPVSTEPPNTHPSSSSLAGALVDPSSNVTPSAVTQQSNAVVQPPEDNAVVPNETSSVLPEAQSHDPVPTLGPRTQAIGNTTHASPRPSASSGVTLMNSPYPANANQYTFTVPNDTARQGYRPVDYSQLVPVPRRKFSDITPNARQEKIPQPQLSKPVPPETSTSALPRQPPFSVRLPGRADRSRLAKDILKQLGRPSGSVPAVPTRHEYKQRKKAEAHTEATSAQLPTEPVVAGPQPLLNHDDPPSPLEIVPVSDQVPPLGLSSNPPPSSPADEPPLLEYPDLDTGLTTCDVDATGEDVNMDIPPPENPLVPQPPASPESNLPLESVPSPVVPEPALDKEERPSKRSAPPPDAEIIEISDDEETVVDARTTTVEPMEVDEEVGTGGVISQSLSELPLVGDNTLITVETEKDPTKEPLGRRPSPGPIDIQFAERRLQKCRPSVEVPPLPDWARRNRGGETAPIQEEDEEGLCEVSIMQIRLLTLLLVS